MGDWYPNPDPATAAADPWLYDADAPTPDPTRAQEPATAMLGPIPSWDPGELYVMPIVTPRDEDERHDGWCEDRSPSLGEITTNDGED